MSVIKKPIVTEKMSSIQEKLNKYGFIVDDKANKVEIRKDIEKMYNVKVEAINTLRTPRKIKQKYTKKGMMTGSTPINKKAIVTLAEGQVIDLYNNI
ncbi:MAG: 50S ribosomal protein L23 [Bacteroidetes bacterium]|nr:50S ribosomal protein L23 [Bacteroidota bacterium]